MHSIYVEKNEYYKFFNKLLHVGTNISTEIFTWNISDLFPTKCRLFHYCVVCGYKRLFSNTRKQFEGPLAEKLHTPGTKPELNTRTIKEFTKLCSYTKKMGNTDVSP
jgi:hypothetical protein